MVLQILRAISWKPLVATSLLKLRRRSSTIILLTGRARLTGRDELHWSRHGDGLAMYRVVSVLQTLVQIGMYNTHVLY